MMEPAWLVPASLAEPRVGSVMFDPLMHSATVCRRLWSWYDHGLPVGADNENTPNPNHQEYCYKNPPGRARPDHPHPQASRTKHAKQQVAEGAKPATDNTAATLKLKRWWDQAAVLWL